MIPPRWSGPDMRDAEWDALLSGFESGSIFQSAAWAAHRRASGWRSERWSADATGIRAAVQLLVHRLPGIEVAWAPGGPIIEPADADASLVAGLLDGLLATIRTRHGPIYMRADAPAPPSSTVESVLACRFSRPAVRLNTGATVILELSSDSDALLAAMSKHHRHEVRRALSHGIEWRSGRGPREIEALVALHGEMTRRKGITIAPQARDSAIRSLCAAFGDGAVVLVGSTEGIPVTACFALVFTDKAFFHTAATGERGLRSAASYGAVHTLALLLAERGVRKLDLGGLDDRGPMLGVARFKEGFGGRTLTRTGEWQWARPSGLAPLMDLALGVRRGALGA